MNQTRIVDAPSASGSFPTTHWSAILAAGHEDRTAADTALAELCRGYWYPLYAFARRKGHQPADAEDLTQMFFTHLLEADARHYLEETRRVLRPGRAALVTAFLFEAGEPSVHRAFPWLLEAGSRARYRSHPTAAIAWKKERFERMVGDAGLRVQWHSPGYYPGREFLTAQDVLLLGH